MLLHKSLAPLLFKYKVLCMSLTCAVQMLKNITQCSSGYTTYYPSSHPPFSWLSWNNKLQKYGKANSKHIQWIIALRRQCWAKKDTAWEQERKVKSGQIQLNRTLAFGVCQVVLSLNQDLPNNSFAWQQTMRNQWKQHIKHTLGHRHF